MHVYAILPSRAGTTPGFWLDQLEEAHSRLLGAIDHLQQLAEGPAPDKELLVTFANFRRPTSASSAPRLTMWPGGRPTPSSATGRAIAGRPKPCDGR